MSIGFKQNTVTDLDKLSVQIFIQEAAFYWAY